MQGSGAPAPHAGGSKYLPSTGTSTGPGMQVSQRQPVRTRTPTASRASPLPTKMPRTGVPVPIIATDCDAHVPLAGQAPVSGIEPNPLKVGQAAFHPGMSGRLRRPLAALAVDVQVA